MRTMLCLFVTSSGSIDISFARAHLRGSIFQNVILIQNWNEEKQGSKNFCSSVVRLGGKLFIGKFYGLFSTIVVFSMETMFKIAHPTQCQLATMNVISQKNERAKSEQMKLQMFGLLHLNENEQSAVNVSTRDFAEITSIYVKNAINLSNSFQSQGISFTLLTNRQDIVLEYVHSAKGNLQVNEIPFITQVPSGISFYSAHFKLDAFRYLSRLTDDYVGLCDLDMACIGRYPVCLHNIVKAKLPLYYDISDQVIPAYGHEIIINNLNLMHGLESEGRWCGGEFIAGTPDFFSRLVKEIDCIYAKYTANIAKMHHVGDEAFTTAALELLRRKGVCMLDAGTLGIVGRYWNTVTLHPQKPFAYYKRGFLLHLPADKNFLAEFSKQERFVSDDFLKRYATYRSSFPQMAKKVARKVYSFLRGIFTQKA